MKRLKIDIGNVAELRKHVVSLCANSYTSVFSLVLANTEPVSLNSVVGQGVRFVFRKSALTVEELALRLMVGRLLSVSPFISG